MQKGVRRKKKIIKNWDWSFFEINVDVETFLYKVLENVHPKYLLSLIRARRLLYSIRNIQKVSLLNTNDHFFQKLQLPWLSRAT